MLNFLVIGIGAALVCLLPISSTDHPLTLYISVASAFGYLEKPSMIVPAPRVSRVRIMPNSRIAYY